MTSQIISVSLLVILVSFVDGVLQGFQNGKSYVITSAATGRVFTSGRTTNFTRNSEVTPSPWNDEIGQKWLALEAPSNIQIAPAVREVSETKRYFLIPHRQEWDWELITKNGASNITRFQNLPSRTEVLSLDSKSGNLTTETFDQNSSSQEWIPEDAGDGQIVLRNLGNNQCVKNFDYKASSIFHKIFTFINRIRKHQKMHDPTPLSTFDCNVKDVSEKWMAEL